MAKAIPENLIHIVPIDDIFIGERAREDLGDIESLQSSIARIGLLNPIVLKHEKNELIGGFRRLTCHKNLGLKTIRATYKEDVSSVMQKVIEHDENLHKELTWSEQAKLRCEIHALLQEEHGSAVKGHKSSGWSQEDTAKFLGISVGTLSEDLALIQSIEYAPQLADFGSKKQALKTIDKMRELAVLTEIARRDVETNDVCSPSVPYTLFEGNSVDIVKEKLDDEIIDLIIFDPPWGIDADVIASSRGPRGEKTFYDDSAETAQNLVSNLMPELFRVLKKDSHMYMFVGMQHANFYRNYLMNLWHVYTEDKQDFFVPFEKDRSWEFDVRVIPLIWVKEGGGFTDFDYKFMGRYEAILFCSKGVRRLNYPSSDVFEKCRPSTLSRIHPQQKPTELIQELIKISTVPNAIVLDPCCGSGVTAVAATLSERRSIVIEQNHEAFLKMKAWVQGFHSESEEGENNA